MDSVRTQKPFATPLLPGLRWGSRAASNSPALHFIGNDSAGTQATLAFPSALLLMAFLNCGSSASHTMRYKYLIRHLQSAIYHL